MRTWKKTTGIILTAIILIFFGYSMAEIIPSTVEPAPVSDFVYVNNGSEVQINAYNGKGGVVRIPNEIEGMPVTRIATQAFYFNDSITGVIFPDHLTYIGDSAFYNCLNLTGILYLPPTVQTVEGHAFQCTNLTGLIITSNCNLEVNAFANIGDLEFIYISEGSAPKIGTAVIAYSEKLTAAIIPNAVNSIKDRNFTASNLLTIYTPANSTAQKFAQTNFIQCNTEQYEAIKKEYDGKYGHPIYMGQEKDAEIKSTVANAENENKSEEIKNADGSRTSGLYTYTIKGNGTVSIIDYNWNNSSGDIYIPSMLDGYPVTAIGEEAFADGKKVNKNDCLVVIPDSVTLIGEKAFYNSPVSTVSIPASVQSIGKAAFAYCDITQFIVDQNQPYFATIDGVLYEKRSKTLLAHPQKKSISSAIPEGIQAIGEYAFSGITIGQSGSSGLCFTDILPSTLTKIEPHAFENCTLYYSTSNAQSGITYYNSNGNDLTLLPAKVTVVGEYAFAGCTFKCGSYSSPETIVIADNLEEIGDYAFSGCRLYDGFEYDLIISKSNLDRIGENAFASSVMISSGNERMKVRIHLPEWIDEIGENAFFETHPVCIQDGMEIRSLGDATFRNTIVYTEMKKEKYQDAIPISLSIPGKIKTIPSQAFAYRFDDKLNTVETIVVQDGIKKIEASAFAGRKSLQTVSLPMTLTEIGEKAFDGCQKIKEITIPESVTKIGDSAFERQFVTLIVTEKSYAALWASENGYNYRYEDNTGNLDWLNSDIH